VLVGERFEPGDTSCRRYGHAKFVRRDKDRLIHHLPRMATPEVQPGVLSQLTERGWRAIGPGAFQMYNDATEVYDPGTMMEDTAARTVTHSVSGGTTLQPVMANDGDNINEDHGDWAEAKLSRTP
jgi:hypothetical protein